MIIQDDQTAHTTARQEHERSSCAVIPVTLQHYKGQAWLSALIHPRLINPALFNPTLINPALMNPR